jgi:hypothetical protein
MHPQLARAPVALEPIEQNMHAANIDPLQRLLDPALGQYGQQARFARPVPHPVPFVPQIQARKFHLGHCRPA